MKQKNEEKRECINCLKCVRQHRKDIFCEDESCVCHTYAVSPTPPVEEEMNKWCRVCKENPNLYCPACDVNLEPVSNQSNTMEDWEKKVNSFILNYCGEYAPHLLDTDENAGQELRNSLSQATQEARKSVIEEIKSGVQAYIKEAVKNPNSDNYIYAENIPLNKLQEILTTLEGK